MNIFNILRLLLLNSILFLLLLNSAKVKAQKAQFSNSEIEAKAKVYQHLFGGTSTLSKKELKKLKNAKQANCGSQQFNANINGECNNINNADWGKANIPLFRELPAEYGPSDPNNSIGGVGRANPRTISNAISKQDSTVFPSQILSSFVFSWGQFLDHDIGISPGNEEDPASIPPTGEAGDMIVVPMHFNRTIVADGTGINSPRQQENIITSWIDGSNVYGSDDERTNWLRLGTHGKLRTSAGNLLPYNTFNYEVDGQIDPNAPEMATEGLAEKVFVAGDVRANEQASLASLHTLFVREHNRICDELINSSNYDPIADDEQIYQYARKRVVAQIQNISFNEFLPALGINLPLYPGYYNTVQPDIMNGFSTAAYRLGHTMVPNELLLLDDDGNYVGQGIVSLIQAFFNPNMVAANGIDPILKGLSIQFQEEIDAKIVEALRTFLFRDGPGPGLDLAALNIQRGRDHGLPDYNTFRQHFTGSVANSVADITSDLNLQGRIESVYPNINDMDPWVGLLSEDKLPNAEIGATLHAMLTEQFTRLRNGDYYFYLNDPVLSAEISTIQNTLLSDIIRRNTNITNIQNDVFRAECNIIAGNCCRLNDSLTLITLYNETGGPNWVNSWNLNQPMTTWHGVTLDAQGCVRILDLSNNGLNGNLPVEIRDLEELTYLDLSGNELSGNIPPNIGNLQKVGYLDLSNNDLTGYIPESLTTMSALTFLYLDNNDLIGGIPVVFNDFPSLGFLRLNNNNLSECFNTTLRVLCDELVIAEISEGNDFPISWDDFCLGDDCDNVIWPGDLNNDGIVNGTDPLYWANAVGFDGPVRPNASTNWTAQPAPEWQQEVLEINSKHQDADGNGIVDAADLQVVTLNFGSSRDIGPTLLSFAPTDLEYRFEPEPSIGGNQRYSIHIDDGEGMPVTANGIAFSVAFGNAPITSVDIDVSSSVLAPNEVFEIYNADRNIFTLALARTDGMDVLCDGPIAIISIDSNNDMSGEEFSINLGTGTVLHTNGEVKNIPPSSFMDTYDGFSLNSSSLEISATVVHEQCNQLGSATVQAYNGILLPPYYSYLYEWSTGANTPTVENLPSGIYSVKVTDANGNSKELPVIIYGQLPIYDSNGNLICSSICADYLNPEGVISSDSFHADNELFSNGTVENGSNVEFKAGERIELKNGFSVESNTTFKADIEDCD